MSDQPTGGPSIPPPPPPPMSPPGPYPAPGMPPAPRKNNKKTWWIVGGVVAVVIIIAAASGASSNAHPTASTTTTRGTHSSPGSAASQQSQAASTPAPTAKPTPTPAPTAPPTPTPPPPPTNFSGSGDKIVAVPPQMVSAPEIVTITNSGGENFVVQGLDSGNQQDQLLVNTIGGYSGTVPLNFNNGETAVHLQVQSTGRWTISIHDISTARSFSGAVKGSGDDVLLYTGDSAIVNITNSGGDNFVVNEYPASGGGNLLVNEIGAYNGQQPLSGGPSMIVVQSTGNWSIAPS